MHIKRIENIPIFMRFNTGGENAKENFETHNQHNQCILDLEHFLYC